MFYTEQEIKEEFFRGFELSSALFFAGSILGIFSILFLILAQGLNSAHPIAASALLLAIFASISGVIKLGATIYYAKDNIDFSEALSNGYRFKLGKLGKIFYKTNTQLFFGR